MNSAIMNSATMNGTIMNSATMNSTTMNSTTVSPLAVVAELLGVDGDVLLVGAVVRQRRGCHLADEIVERHHDHLVRRQVLVPMG